MLIRGPRYAGDAYKDDETRMGQSPGMSQSAEALAPTVPYVGIGAARTPHRKESILSSASEG